MLHRVHGFLPPPLHLFVHLISILIFCFLLHGRAFKTVFVMFDFCLSVAFVRASRFCRAPMVGCFRSYFFVVVLLFSCVGNVARHLHMLSTPPPMSGGSELMPLLWLHRPLIAVALAAVNNLLLHKFLYLRHPTTRFFAFKKSL